MRILLSLILLILISLSYPNKLDWNRLGGPSAGSVSKLYSHNRIFYGISNRSLWYSKDLGQTWTHALDTLHHVDEIFFTSEQLVVIDLQKGVFRCSYQLSNVENIFSNTLHWESIIANGVMYVIGKNMFIYASFDGGNIWKLQNSQFQNGNVIRAMGVYNNLLLASNGDTLFVSSDSGAKFEPWPLSLDKGEYGDYFGPLYQKGDALFMGTSKRGPVVTYDSGKTWIDCSNGKSGDGSQFFHHNGYYLYTGAIMRSEGLYRSQNMGQSWTPVVNGINAKYLWGSFFSMTSIDSVLLVASSIGIHRSIDNGENWLPVERGPIPAFFPEFIIKDHIAILTEGNLGRLFYSVDTAQTWMEVDLLHEDRWHDFTWFDGHFYAWRDEYRYGLWRFTFENNNPPIIEKIEIAGETGNAVISHFYRDGPRFYVFSQFGTHFLEKGSQKWNIYREGLASFQHRYGGYVFLSNTTIERKANPIPYSEHEKLPLQYFCCYSTVSYHEGVSFLNYKDTILIGGGGGAFYSADSGATWEPWQVSRPVINQFLLNGDELYIASDNGLQYLSDTGWSNTSSEYIYNTKNAVISGNYIYISMSKYGLLRTPIENKIPPDTSKVPQKTLPMNKRKDLIKAWFDQGFLVISDLSHNGLELEMLNIKGQVLKSTKMTGDRMKISLETNMEKGIYLLEFRNSAKELVQIIKLVHH